MITRSGLTALAGMEIRSRQREECRARFRCLFRKRLIAILVGPAPFLTLYALQYRILIRGYFPALS